MWPSYGQRGRKGSLLGASEKDFALRKQTRMESLVSALPSHSGPCLMRIRSHFAGTDGKQDNEVNT